MCDKGCPGVLPRRSGCRLSILGAAVGICLSIAASRAPGQEEPLTPEGYEREELGVNQFTTPSIAKIFEQLDALRPLPFDQLRRPLPGASPASREQAGLIFGGLIADGFLLVEAQRRNLVDEFGRVLLREARGLGVGDRVLRHSASLTELAKRGDWPAVRHELVVTQADVEQAMIELRDQRMAHLISLGGWLRGLEITAAAVAHEFTPSRAGVLRQSQLLDYFAAEINTLPPATAQLPLFQRIRTNIAAIRATLTTPGGLTLDDVRAVEKKAEEVNSAIRRANAD